MRDDTFDPTKAPDAPENRDEPDTESKGNEEAPGIGGVEVTPISVTEPTPLWVVDNLNEASRLSAAYTFLRGAGYTPACVVLLADDRIAWTDQLLFTCAIRVGVIGGMGPEDGWCYRSEVAAMAALLAWNEAESEEPAGWHRHPGTGRRRADGDPSREHVNL